MKKIITGVIILALILAAGFKMKANHDKINSTKNLNSGISSVISVQTYTVQPMEISQALNLVGTLSPNSEVNIAAEAQGVITSLNVEAGQVKSQGAVIATIDSKLKQLAVRSARVALAKQKRDLSRYENLLRGGSATQQQVDDARTALENAVIALEQAQKQLTDATVKAPISGVITKKLVDKGAFINVGTAIASIVDISRLKLKLSVSERNVYKIKVGEKATITTDIYPGETFEGKVTFVSAKGDDSHNYDVEIQVVNSKKNPLKAGTFANAMIDQPAVGKKLYIPREALQGSTREAKVYVAENGKAHLRNIVVREADNKFLEVQSGLSEGEVVVTAGQINLEDGKAIKVAN
ncbi:MAG: efflux RND transporter periplasmic adaptor subunit [Bacteroidota bacterium]|nr:efflux RND transporter periplasmic adaptor subunit [Bacteroidota bacterium]